MNKNNITGWAGVLAPFIFVSVFTLEGWLRPGYNSTTEYVSALSLGPRGWIQVANFLVFGLLLFLFSRAVAVEIPSGKSSRAGLIILTILSICFFFSGPFVMDPAGTPLEKTTIHGLIHGILGAIAFLLMPYCIFIYLRRFTSDPTWKSMRLWSLGLGIISTLGLVGLTITSKFPQLQNSFSPWFGLIQRTLIIPFMVWLFLFALELRRRLIH